jgi:Metallo-beta-lactamase superfamily
MPRVYRGYRLNFWTVGGQPIDCGRRACRDAIQRPRIPAASSSHHTSCKNRIASRSLDLTVESAIANPAFDITVPDNVRNAPPLPPVTVNAQKLADGVFWLTGGTHHTLAIEMKDHIVLVDTPNGEARALAVIAKAKDVIPGKPIRYVVAMHHHWDHLGGAVPRRASPWWLKWRRRAVDEVVAVADARHCSGHGHKDASHPGCPSSN